MDNATYSNKLRDPRWQRRRLEIMVRDGFTCLFCGDDQTTLNVHHKVYRANTSPWEYEDDNFQTLCEHCHAGAERLKERNATAIICAKSLGGLPDYQITLSFIAENEKGRFLAIFIYDTTVKKVIAECKEGVIAKAALSDLLLLSNRL